MVIDRHQLAVYLSNSFAGKSISCFAPRSQTEEGLEVWLDHVVAQRAARAACTGMSIISA